MPKYLIDVNLPYYFSIWNSDKYVHQLDIEPRAKDKDIWQYAIENELIIITKDSDFFSRIVLANPPPKVIHIRDRNMNMKEFYQLINSCWEQVEDMVRSHKLVIVYKDRLEGVN